MKNMLFPIIWETFPNALISTTKKLFFIMMTCIGPYWPTTEISWFYDILVRISLVILGKMTNLERKIQTSQFHALYYLPPSYHPNRNHCVMLMKVIVNVFMLFFGKVLCLGLCDLRIIEHCTLAIIASIGTTKLNSW